MESKIWEIHFCTEFPSPFWVCHYLESKLLTERLSIIYQPSTRAVLEEYRPTWTNYYWLLANQNMCYILASRIHIGDANYCFIIMWWSLRMKWILKNKMLEFLYFLHIVYTTMSLIRSLNHTQMTWKYLWLNKGKNSALSRKVVLWKCESVCNNATWFYKQQ